MRLNGIDDRLDRQQYPATTAEIVATHGNVRMELADGSERLGDVLERFGDATYVDTDDVLTALRAGVCHRAVGRRFYSDRDPTTVGEDGTDPVSF